MLNTFAFSEKVEANLTASGKFVKPFFKLQGPANGRSDPFAGP
jgi:hypothetical protein